MWRARWAIEIGLRHSGYIESILTIGDKWERREGRLS